jgi:endonuclease YncB( thermonuclease family)
LADIDAPALEQEYGMKAKQYIGNLLFGKEVRVRNVTKHSNGQFTGRVFLGDLDVNAEVVQQGFAWALQKDRNLIRLQAKARQQKLGLWASDHAVPPWEWTH